MGLFGSRTKTQVGTSVSRVIEDNALPNSIMTGIIKASMENDGQLVEHAIEELSGSLGIRMHQFYRYGRDHYANGLPSGTSMTNLRGRNTIKQAIEAEVGDGVTLDYYKVGPINLLHLGWHLLVRDYDYKSNDNSFTYNGVKVYLTNMQPVVTDATVAELESGSMDRWGVSPLNGITPARKYPVGLGMGHNEPVFIVDAAASSDHLLIKYCHEIDGVKVLEGVNVPIKQIVHAEFTLSVAGWDMEATYHQAGYSYNSKNGYWMYQIDSGLNAAVEAVFDNVHEPNGTFFPMAYFRYNKKALSQANQPEYNSTKKLLKYINMDYEEVVGGINANPDIADVEQAIMTLAVPADTKNEIERRYLFDFFTNLWTAASQTQATSSSIQDFDMAGLFNEDRPASTIVIQDKKFKMALSWSTITKRRVSGNIAKVGEHHSVTNTQTDIRQIISADSNEVVDWTTSLPTHFYRRQLTETVYEEIQVQNMKMVYHIFEQYTTTGDENNKDILMVPLDYAISSQYSNVDREILYARSLHYIFNSRVVTKLKWYQTGIFKAILIIVAIVVTVITYGASIQALYGAIVAGGAAATAAYIAIATAIAKYIVVSALIDLFVKEVGGKIAFIVAIIAIAYAGYRAIQAGSIQGAPWAKELLSVSTNLTNAAGKQFQAEFNDLLTEFRSFQEYAKEQTEKLKEVNALMDGNIHLIPMVVFGETPDEFYQRTVHSGNIGIVGIDAVSSFVDAALTLPKLSESIGDYV